MALKLHCEPEISHRLTFKNRLSVDSINSSSMSQLQCSMILASILYYPIKKKSLGIIIVKLFFLFFIFGVPTLNYKTSTVIFNCFISHFMPVTKCNGVSSSEIHFPISCCLWAPIQLATTTLHFIPSRVIY